MKYAKSLIIAAVLVLAMGFSRHPKIQPIADGSTGSGIAGMYAANGSDNYIVRPGETLSMIASQNGTTASALEQANSILASTNNTVQTGERLNVPNANEGPTAVLVQGSGSSATSSSGSSQPTLVIGGFPANTALQIGVGMETGQINSVMNATTDSNGQLTQPVSMPSGSSSQMSGKWVAVVITMSGSNSSSGSGSSSSSSSSNNSGSSSSNSSSTSANSGQILVVSNSLSIGSSSSSTSSSGSASSTGSSSSSSTGAPANSSSGSSNGSSSGNSGTSSSTRSSSSSNGSSANPSGSSSGSSSSSSSSSSNSATIPSTGKSSPTVKLTPTQGGPGTRVLVQASGFPSNTDVYVNTGLKGSTPGNLAMDQTDANGNLSVYVTIPASAQGSQQGTWMVTVTTATGTPVTATSGAFTIPAAPAISSSSSSSSSATIPSTGKSSPVVKLTPTQGGPGTRVLVQASGFPANTAVNVMLGAKGSSSSNMANLATDQTDANGNLSVYVTIPNRAQGSQQATWMVTVATATGTSVSAKSGAFTVPAAPAS